VAAASPAAGQQGAWSAPAIPPVAFQPPVVIFQPPDIGTARPDSDGRAAGESGAAANAGEQDGDTGRPASRRRGSARGAGRAVTAAGQDDLRAAPDGGARGGSARDGDGRDGDGRDGGDRDRDRDRQNDDRQDQDGPAGDGQPGADQDGDGEPAGRRRRRGGRGHSKSRGVDADGTDGETAAAGDAGAAAAAAPAAGGDSAADDADAGDDDDGNGRPGRRRRRRRRSGTGGDGEAALAPDDPPDTVVHVRPPRQSDSDDVRSVRGSTRLEAKRQRRRESRDSGRRRPPVITESEFLSRREAVERVMVVRQTGERTQIAVLEDGVLVEHYVDKASHQSYVGNVYLGKVQNVLPSMEAAFVDIGKGRNAVLYAGEVNFDASGLEGESKRIESALKSGQAILVQVTKDPIGHKGARLTSQVSLPGRYLVYVPGSSMTGISRKLPDTERTRLKQILKKVMPEHAGVIVRTAAEGASEEELSNDVARLSAQWEEIERRTKAVTAPDQLSSEPDLTIRVIRDIFNEDFIKLIIASDSDWDLVDEYVRYVAPQLAGRMERWDGDGDVFAAYRIDEQLAKALERKVWLPSGGSLVIDATEAMTVIDVNTGKFTGQGGNLEQTVTRNNLEAAEEIVRQLRVRDVGGIIVIDFIDMVLESNRELVLRRMLECLARDRTKHQVAEVTSLGLVQMTRKRVGSGLLEAFSVPCEHCNGRGVHLSLEPVDHTAPPRGRSGDGRSGDSDRSSRSGDGNRSGRDDKKAGAAAALSAVAASSAGSGLAGSAAADEDLSGGGAADGAAADGDLPGGAAADGAGIDGDLPGGAAADGAAAGGDPADGVASGGAAVDGALAGDAEAVAGTPRSRSGRRSGRRKPAGTEQARPAASVADVADGSEATAQGRPEGADLAEPAGVASLNGTAESAGVTMPIEDIGPAGGSGAVEGDGAAGPSRPAAASRRRRRPSPAGAPAADDAAGD